MIKSTRHCWASNLILCLAVHKKKTTKGQNSFPCLTHQEAGKCNKVEWMSVMRQGSRTAWSCSLLGLEVVCTGEESLPRKTKSCRKQCCGFWLKFFISSVYSLPGHKFKCLRYLEAIPAYWSESALQKVCGCEQAQKAQNSSPGADIIARSPWGLRTASAHIWCCNQLFLRRNLCWQNWKLSNVPHLVGKIVQWWCFCVCLCFFLFYFILFYFLFVCFWINLNSV